MTQIATLVFGLGILGLFMLDRDKKARTSIALWIPAIWMLLAGSRTVSEWLQLDSPRTADQYLDGSPIDRAVYTSLLALGLIVLATRRHELGSLLRRNTPLLVFFSYCAISTIWSDFPAVAFKRWSKAVGDVVMILIVVSEPDRYTAIKRFLARCGFLLIPFSILFIKYYPSLGRGYSPWIWTPFYVGVTNNKNMLGMICMTLGLGSVWRFVHAFQDRRGRRVTGPLVAHGAVLVMVMWLLLTVKSATSLTCLLLGGGLIATINLWRVARKPLVIHSLVVAILAVSISAVFLDLGGGLVQTLGRDPTLTGRTEIWKLVLGMATNPLFGTGFESFWLGPRLEKLWSMFWWHPNEAHNGYIEVYLNLGWVGLALLGVVFVRGYRSLVVGCRHNLPTASLRLAYLVVGLVYSFTEAGFRMMAPVWITFLLAATVFPEARTRGKPKVVVTPLSKPETVPCLQGL